jgi:hypothetical protein
MTYSTHLQHQNYGIEAHAMANYVQKTDATIQSHGTP